MRPPLGLFRCAAIWVFALGALAPQAHALDPELSVLQYAHDEWHRRDGLPSTVVHCLAQTNDGYLWLGTPSGLVRFDGVSFSEIATHPVDLSRREYISALQPTKEGGLWIGTKYDGLRHYRDGEMRDSPLSGAAPTIHAFLLHSDGALFLATPNGLSRVEPDGTATAVPTTDSFVATLAEDAQGRLWAASHVAIDVIAAGARALSVPLEKRLTQVMLRDRGGRMWLGTSTGLVLASEGAGTAIDPNRVVLSERITALFEDRDGTLWVGTPTELIALKTEGAAMEERGRLKLNHVLDLEEDREGSLWIATEDGLHRLKDVNVVPWTTDQGLLSNETTSVVGARDGTVYFFTGGVNYGVTAKREGQFQTYPGISDGPSTVTADGSLWVGTTGKLTRLKDGVTTEYLAAHNPNGWSSSLAELDDGLLVTYGRFGGVQRFRDGVWTPYLFRDGTPYTAPFHVLSSHRQQDGTIWLAGYDGLVRLKDGDVTRYATTPGVESAAEWYRQNPQSPKYFRTVVSDGMADYWLTSIAEDAHGTLWLASHRGGLTRLRDGKFTPFTTQHGLVTNQLFSVLVDNSGDLWLGSPRGILHVPAQDLEDVADGKRDRVRCELFTTDDGMKSEEVNHAYQPNAYKAPDGVLWFATKQGAVSIDPKRLKRNTVRPPVVVDQVSADGVKLDLTAPPELPIAPEKLEFHFSALSLLVPERVRFRYQLEGYDADWVDSGTRRVAQYTKLPPGKYRFRVIASNNDGVWNETGATYAFELKPAFHQTYSFYLLCALAVAAAIWAAHRWRVRQLRAREMLLQARVEQRTEELSKTNAELTREVSERQRAEKEVDRIHRELLTASHRAGMAEVATGVLHNVGNVLNSVNVTAAVLMEKVKNSRVTSVAKVAALLKEHQTDLGAFLSTDPKGKRVPAFLDELGQVAQAEQGALLREIEGLRENVEHIRDIVSMQQNYATVAGVAETVPLSELFEDAVRMNSAALARHGVTLVRDYDPGVPPVLVEKHKVLQILVNLIQNAKYACDEAGQPEKRIVLKVGRTPGGAAMSVSDNGVGIAPENRVKIFHHGFTTRKNGHGFGLHSGALAAKSLGGSLRAESDGIGKGATFVLELPLKPGRGPTSASEAPGAS